MLWFRTSGCGDCLVRVRFKASRRQLNKNERLRFLSVGVVEFGVPAIRFADGFGAEIMGLRFFFDEAFRTSTIACDADCKLLRLNGCK